MAQHGAGQGGCFKAIFGTLRLRHEPAHAACVEEAKLKDGRYKATSMVDWKCKHCGKREDISTSGRRTRGCAETLRSKGENTRRKRRSADKGRGRCIANHGPLSSLRSRSLSDIAAAFRDRVSIALRCIPRVS